VKVILTGSSGFLGSHLKRFFENKGIEVLSLKYRPETESQFIAETVAALSQGDVLAFLNAGASQLSGDDPDSVRTLTASNVYLPAAVASLILKQSPQTSFIHFGSSWQIGEDGDSSPFNAYAATKSAAESLLEHYVLAGLRAASLRLFDTYGPGDSRKKVINLVADALIQDTELPMSKAEQVVDLVYITDVLAAVERTIELLTSHPAGQFYRYSVRSGRQVRILDIVDLLKVLSGKPAFSKIQLGFYPYRNRERFQLPPATDLPPNWRPVVSLEDGLRHTLADRGLPVHP
jgi:nucleoside-diphosphate-sugar epimerase